MVNSGGINMTTANKQTVVLTEQDVAYTLLCDLKRVVREYATAATESSCPDVRAMFTQLLNKALTTQGNLFNAMKSAQLYDQPLLASQTDIKQQVDAYKQTEQKLTAFLTQHQQLTTMSASASSQSAISSS